MERREFKAWLVILFGLLSLQIATSSVVWDFGVDEYGTSVIAQASGDISIFDKEKRVTLSIPTCMEVKYVHVEVFNHLTTPAVNFNKDTNTVTIAYKLLQLSLSKYQILAKGKPNPMCGGGGGGYQKPNYYNDYNYYENSYY